MGPRGAVHGGRYSSGSSLKGSLKGYFRGSIRAPLTLRVFIRVLWSEFGKDVPGLFVSRFPRKSFKGSVRISIREPFLGSRVFRVLRLLGRPVGLFCPFSLGVLFGDLSFVKLTNHVDP